MNSKSWNVANFFGTDITYLANSGKWLAISQILGVLLSILLASAFANLLTQEAYGTYKYFLSLLGFFSIFSLQGIGTSVARTVSRGTETNIFSGLKIKLIWGTLGSVASFCTGIYYLWQGDGYFGWTLICLSLTIPLFGGLTVYQSYLTGKKQFKAVAKNTVFVKILSTILLIGTIFVTQEIWILVFVYVLITILLNGFSLYNTLKKFPPKDTVVDRDLSDGKHLSIMSGIGVVSGTLQSIALWHFIGPAGLAVYSLALAPIEQIRPFIKFSENIFLPKLAQDSWQNGNLRWFIKKTYPFALVLAIGVAIYILLAPYLYKFLFPNYQESIIYSQILAVGLFFTAFNVVINTILKAKKDIYAMYHIHSIGSFVNILLVLVSIYYFDILGLAVSIVAYKIIVFFIGLRHIINVKNNLK